MWLRGPYNSNQHINCIIKECRKITCVPCEAPYLGISCSGTPARYIHRHMVDDIVGPFLRTKNWGIKIIYVSHSDLLNITKKQDKMRNFSTQRVSK
jgi:hypothetical protein